MEDYRLGNPLLEDDDRDDGYGGLSPLQEVEDEDEDEAGAGEEEDQDQDHGAEQQQQQQLTIRKAVFTKVLSFRTF